MNPFENENNEDNIVNIEEKVEIWVAVFKGKKNTYISGLLYQESEMKDHLKNIKKKHGCNGSIKTSEENSTKLIIQLQGDHINHICDYFEDLGITNIIVKGE